MKYNTRTQQSGFTLIELITVVAVIAILAAMAYRSYTGSVVKAQLSDAQNILLSTLGLENRHQTNTGAYTLDLTDLGLMPVGGVFLSDEGYYQIGSRICAANNSLNDCIELVATPTSKAMSSDILTANSIGQRTPANSW